METGKRKPETGKERAKTPASVFAGIWGAVLTVRRLIKAGKGAGKAVSEGLQPGFCQMGGAHA